MYIIASFQHSTFLELAIADLEQNGVSREKILAVPLKKCKEKRRLFDTINYADGISLFDAAAVLGAIGMLLGVIYGFVLTWGPILWGLIGLIIGGGVGFALDFLFQRRQDKKLAGEKATEVVLIINCDENLVNKADDIIRTHFALGVGMLER
jgi:hypothetical protein